MASGRFGKRGMTGSCQQWQLRGVSLWVPTSTGAPTSICWACRASAPLCRDPQGPVPGLDPPGALLVASGLRERLGFLGGEGHQAPARASAGAPAPACSQHGSGPKPWSYAWGMGCGVSALGGMAGTLSVTTGSFLCQECWVMRGYGVTELLWGGVRVGPWLGAPTVSPSHPGWWHTVVTPWRWPSLGTLVTGCAQAGGNLSSWGGWAWARAQHRWHLSPGGLHCHSSPSPVLEPRAGDCKERGRRVSGGWSPHWAAPSPCQ